MEGQPMTSWSGRERYCETGFQTQGAKQSVAVIFENNVSTDHGEHVSHH